MLSEQLSDQDIEDGNALAKMTPEQRGALQRLVARMERDLYREYAESNEKKAWLKGARRVLADFQASLAQTVEDVKEAKKEIEADRQLQGEASGSAGDLALD